LQGEGLFDEAQAEIFRLMRYDPYQRYARTDEGIKFRTKLSSSPSEPSGTPHAQGASGTPVKDEEGDGMS